jgi:3',5'-cyclic AMP phosphodiesterase CpdA
MPFHLWPSAGRTTRRDFLAGLAVGSVALTVADPAPAGDEDGPWFALVSDTHVPEKMGQKALGQVPADNLRIVVADILARPRRPEGVLINGDLALKEGKPGDYVALLTLLEPLRKAGLPIHLTLGNHDDRGPFREAIRGVIPAGSAVEQKYAGAFEAMGRRFLLLDSLDEVDKVPGRLGGPQLAWLGRELDTHKGVPTLVFVHHPPHSSARGKKPDALLDGDELLKLLRPRPWVEALVFGHTHRWAETSEAGLDLVNLPAVAYSFLPDQPLGYCRLNLAGGRPRFALRDVVRKTGVDGKVWHRRPRHHHTVRV